MEVEVEAVGCHNVANVINTGPFLPLLMSWSPPRGLKKGICRRNVTWCRILSRRAAISWESHSRASKAFFASSNALGLADPLFLRGLTSCAGSPAEVRPAGRLGVAKGGLARAARSKREAGSQVGRNHHGGAPGARWYLGGKKYLQIGHWPWM
jgi:hypothetical protein